MRAPKNDVTTSAIRCAAWPSPKIAGRSSGSGLLSAAAKASGSTPTSVFQPASHGVGPLGLLAQRHAAHAPQVGLALDAAGIGRDRAGAALELEHARVGDRVDELHVDGGLQVPRVDAARVRGCSGITTGRVERARQAKTVPRRSGVSVL